MALASIYINLHIILARIFSTCCHMYKSPSNRPHSIASTIAHLHAHINVDHHKFNIAEI
ncbi:hypothetical protein M758_6G126600 [Ceratodon purpureus]|uniref:Uncharacterized protein n=1 Tax=Ceratodon purpureus TaxID=3225 RepID=A0A8T0HGA3_CERPU|nr:hypothetical protein KC19_6G131800 [Ceratodon purpureus]KAG0613740.1 hypothetical protein M758_6G126600 [Ceratodon purpureus]